MKMNNKDDSSKHIKGNVKPWKCPTCGYLINLPYCVECKIQKGIEEEVKKNLKDSSRKERTKPNGN